MSIQGSIRQGRHQRQVEEGLGAEEHAHCTSYAEKHVVAEWNCHPLPSHMSVRGSVGQGRQRVKLFF